MRFLIVVLLCLLTACTWLKTPMTGATLRAALDECQENDLNTLVYARTDSSIMAVRCVPKPDQVAKTIRIRPYVPMKIIRHFTQLEEVVE